MLKQMIKISLKGSFSSIKRKDSTKARNTLPMIIAIFCLVGVSYYMMYKELAGLYVLIGMGEAYFESLGSSLFIFLLVIDVSMAATSLLESRYNDILLSMPIEPIYIVIARISAVLIYGYIIELSFGIPCIIAWNTVTGFDLGLIARGIVVLVFWRLIPLGIGVLIGYLFNRLTARSKNKNLIKVLLTLLFLGGYYMVIFKTSGNTASIENANTITKIANILFPLKWFADGIYNANVLSILLIAVIGLVIMALTILFLNKVLFSSISSMSGAVNASKKANYKQLSPMGSLLKRERKRFFGSYTYLVNNIISVMFLIAGGVYLIIKRADIMPYFAKAIKIEYGVAGVVVLCLLMCGMYFVSSCSISIEGRTIDTLKSLPLKAITVLDSKILFHYVIIGVAALAVTVALGFFYKVPLLMWVPLVFIPQLYIMLTGMAGLYINLIFPRFDWMNEAQVVKRSGSSLLAMLVNMAIIALLVMVYVIFIDYLPIETYLLCATAFLFVMCCIQYYVISTAGVKRYNNL